jgi:hypothetical protein
VGVSARAIDYNLRPAKALERYAIADFISAAMKAKPEAEYAYAGMGSFAFKDFVLYHKLFGFKQMFSAENEQSLQTRCIFNRPFPNVSLHFGDADEMLRDLEWDSPFIVWLDYDGQVGSHVFEAVDTASKRAADGSLLIVTLNAHYTVPVGWKAETEFVNTLKIAIGSDNVEKFGLEPNSFRGQKATITLEKLLTARIQSAVQANVHTSPDQAVQAQLAFLFQYEDGARMMTAGYYIGKKESCERFEAQIHSSRVLPLSCGRPYKIGLPTMTPRERRYLEQRLNDLPGAVNEVGMVITELQDLQNTYIYWPYFAESLA